MKFWDNRFAGLFLTRRAVANHRQTAAPDDSRTLQRRGMPAQPTAQFKALPNLKVVARSLLLAYSLPSRHLRDSVGDEALELSVKLSFHRPGVELDIAPNSVKVCKCFCCSDRVGLCCCFLQRGVTVHLLTWGQLVREIWRF